MISSDGHLVELPLGTMNNGMLTLDLSGVQNGVYFIRIVEKNLVTNEKLVVNR